MYNFKKIEAKWQEKWFKDKTFAAVDFHPTKPKYYALYEFYNISGNLHMGHLKGTVPADALARYKRFKGFNVLFPIGGDSFGLPAENAAIKKGINPHQFVAEGMNTAMEQSRKLGLSFDWDRTICTSDPDYYKWTQWIFLQLLKNGKAYKSKGIVNFCPKCKTVLSNEDSQNGRCDRCDTPVIQKERSVWFLKMQEYAEKLLTNVDNIVMADNLKDAQRNWIGKSEGAIIKFKLKEVEDILEVFTTRADTLYGATFMVMAPEHSYLTKYQDKITNLEEVKNYQKKASEKSNIERTDATKDKTGVMIKGLTAINPVNNEEIPIWLSDYVLIDYGTGAIMAVPAHDDRDYAFAKKFNIKIIPVIEGGDITKEAYIGEGKMINSDILNGLTDKKSSIDKMVKYLEEQKIGTKKTNYKMQDWPFNRQRYWGEPFPVVFCEKCVVVPLDEKDLPLVLPETDDYFPNEKGDSPLAKIDKWVNTTCPICGGPAKRETDTMPNWAGSSWYWLRYIDPKNNNRLADMEKLKYWGSVDFYTGGTEHITRHVLYAFFWQNFLFEIGAVPSRDPFIRKMGSGLVLDDQGKKMSKSSTNGVSPMKVIDEYGSDVARLHLHFLGGFEDNTPWTFDGINGITSFLKRVWSLQDIIKGEEISKEHLVELNKLIKKISEDIENCKLNTMISAYMIFVNKIKESGFITKEELRQFLILLNPLAPHITSEMFEIVFNSQITDQTWPEYDETKTIDEVLEIGIQVNGKLRGTIAINLNEAEDSVRTKALNDSNVKRYLEGKEIVKTIVVPNRIVSIIIK